MKLYEQARLMGLEKRRKQEYNKNINGFKGGGGVMSQNQSLSTQEVADILHVSKSTITTIIYHHGRKK